MSNVKGKMSKVPCTRVYMDYASTTPLDPRVLKAMMPYLGETFGNPSSIHAEGAAAKKAIDASRRSVALALQAHADEIVFTSGGTEANNLAIFGTVDFFRKSPLIKGVPHSDEGRVVQPPPRRLGTPFVKGDESHIVTTTIEHASVLEPIRELERRGVAVTYVPVEPNGIVKPEKIAAALRPNTVLVSVQYANNEIGTIQPIPKIAREIRDFRDRLKSQIPISKSQTNSKSKIKKVQTPIFHCDASQASLYLNCLVERLGVDLMTLDGHKMYGPKGVGMLYVRRGVRLVPILFGGGQERGARSTTENVPAIVGFAKALDIAVAERERESARLTKLREYCYSEVLENIRMTEVVINGDMKERLPNNINISTPDLDTEFALLQLDAAGIACSTKSSCLGSEGGSYVVRALIPPSRTASARRWAEARANSTLRFTFGRATTKKDIQYLIAHLGRIVEGK